MAPILQVQNLNHIYSVGTPFEHVALDNVSFSVERGEFIGVIGHTGSGKSTLMQHLNGLLKPTSGAVILDGKDIWSDKQITRQSRFRVGLVFQYPEYQLFEETVYKDIAFGPTNMGLSKEEVHKRIVSAAKALELKPELLKKSPFELSGGQKRRVAIAGVIAMQPEVLVLDEPAAGLDPAGRERVMRLITNYRDKTGNTVIIVSHSMEDAAKYADKIIVLNDGKLFLVGNADRVFDSAESLSQIGLNVPPITRVVAALREKGIDIPKNIYTPQAAAEALLPLMKGGRE